MKAVKKVSIPSSPKHKRKQWERIVKKHLNKAFATRLREELSGL